MTTAPLRRLLALALFAHAACSQTPEQRLLQEFAGAYPEHAQAGGAVREFSLAAAANEVTLVDGNRMRVWAYNGQVPGPTLRVKLGERVRAKFENRLPQATTIHWHGVRVPNDMDGVPTAARPAIAPGESFTYEFTPKDAGTYWYHPHHRSSEQVERGLYGLLIVDDRSPPYARDESWVLDDWLLGEDGQIVEKWNTVHDLMHDGRWGNRITINGRTSTRLRLAPGERIRLRLLNSANGRVFRPVFDGLEVKLIAVDGSYLRAPIAYAPFDLAPGNRIDLEVTAPATHTATVEIWDRFYERRPNQLAEIEIVGEPLAPSRATAPVAARVPSWKEAAQVPVREELVLDARRGGSFGIEWTINGRAFPDHAHMALPRRKFSRVRFVNKSARLHPIHIHGMFFKLLSRNGVTVDEPHFRDTVLMRARETIELGVVPLDEGEWMLHCHILEHAEAGMMMMVNVR